MSRACLRFEGMPERHAELAWRFGEPDELIEGTSGDETGNRWAIYSPVSPGAELREHLEWASGQLHPHEAFVRELITLGGIVVLSLRIEHRPPFLPCRFNARLLLPMAHAGVQIEFSDGSDL